MFSGPELMRPTGLSLRLRSSENWAVYAASSAVVESISATDIGEELR